MEGYKSKESNIINIMKGLGILAVVVGHSTSFSAIKELKLLNVIIYSFHMPLFFIVGGIFLKNKFSFVKDLKRIYVPFLIASIFWVFIAHYLVQLPTYFRSKELYPIDYNFLNQIKKFTKAIFLAKREDIVGNGLWFLVALFISRLLWGLIHGIFKLEITLKYVLIVLCVNVLIYYSIKEFEVKNLFWMWPQAIMGYLFLIFGK